MRLLILPRLFCLQMSLKGEKSHKIEHREIFMLHRMDVQRLSGKKGMCMHGRLILPHSQTTPASFPDNSCLQSRSACSVYSAMLQAVQGWSLEWPENKTWVCLLEVLGLCCSDVHKDQSALFFSLQEIAKLRLLRPMSP